MQGKHFLGTGNLSSVSQLIATYNESYLFSYKSVNDNNNSIKQLSTISTAAGARKLQNDC